MRNLFRAAAVLSAGLMTIGFASSAQAGNVYICNKKQTTYYIASFRKEGPLSCAFRRTSCSIVSAGWWAVKPGQCHRPKTGLFHETYLVIMARNSQGVRESAQFGINERVLSGRRFRGSSGVKDRRVCVKWNSFDRRVPGNWNAVFNKKCPTGFVSFPVSMYARGVADGDETINLR